MKQFLAFVRKEFLYILRDPRTMLILLAMPIVMMLLFGFAITTEVKNTHLVIYDPSHDAVTQKIIERFSNNAYFVIDKEVRDLDEVENLFKSGETNLCLAFSENFASDMLHTHEATVQILADGSEPNQASMRVNYATQVLGEIQREMMQQAAANSSLSTPHSSLFLIQPQMKMLFNPQQKSEFNFVPGVIGMMLLLICAMMSSIAIVRERETGTMEVLLASPLPPSYIVIAKAVPYFCISSFDLATTLCVARFILNIPIAGSLLTIVALALVYIFMALSLGLLISSIAQSQLAAMLLSSMVLMLPTILLSGMMFPIEAMPWWLKDLSAIIPARWFIAAIRKLMIQGVSLQFVVKEFIILAAMAAFFLTIAIKKFKIRLE